MAAITYPFVEALIAERSWPRSHTLDIGCGVGQYRQAAHGNYVGLDLPSSAYGAAPDVFADGSSLPFPDQSFDLVFGVASFFLVRDIQNSFRESRRVLRPHGRLLVIGYEPGVARRQQATDGATRHTWTLAAHRTSLLEAGFIDVTRISERAYADASMTRPRRLAQRLRTLGPARIWLVVEATT